MIVYEFRSAGGKSYIRKFLDALSAEERSFGEDIILHLEEGGLEGLDVKRCKALAGEGVGNIFPEA